MKNNLTLLCAVLFAAGAWAQTPDSTRINYGNRIIEGTVLLGGGFNFSNSSNDNYEEKISIVSLSFTYALGQRFGLGVGIGYSSTNYTFGIDSPNESEQNNNLFYIAPAFTTFGRVHWGWLQPSATISVPFSFGENYRDQHTTSIGGALSAGLNIYLSKKLALNGSLGILSYSDTKVKDEDGSQIDFQFGFAPANLNIGLIFVFGGE